MTALAESAMAEFILTGLRACSALRPECELQWPRLVEAVASWLSEGRVLTCAFCGQEYAHGTPPTQHEALTAHVLACEKHPLRQQLAAVAALRVELGEANEALAACQSECGGTIHALRQQLAAAEARAGELAGLLGECEEQFVQIRSGYTVVAGAEVKLKRCPFCGGEASPGNASALSFAVCCLQCGASTGEVELPDDWPPGCSTLEEINQWCLDKAIEAWQRRTA